MANRSVRMRGIKNKQEKKKHSRNLKLISGAWAVFLELTYRGS